VEISSPQLWSACVFKKKLPKESNLSKIRPIRPINPIRPMGKNSPNLVTLLKRKSDAKMKENRMKMGPLHRNHSIDTMKMYVCMFVGKREGFSS
jgi:hypothetical protein